MFCHKRAANAPSARVRAETCNVFSLSQNCIGPEGITALGKALEENSTLVDLEYVLIGPQQTGQSKLISLYL